MEPFNIVALLQTFCTFEELKTLKEILYVFGYDPPCTIMIFVTFGNDVDERSLSLALLRSKLVES